ncbi:MAG: zinc ribbon domain-containing protein [Thermoleophilia bacterium]
MSYLLKTNKALKKLAVIFAITTVFSAALYYIDEFAFAYRQVRGNAVVLTFLQPALALVITVLFFMIASSIAAVIVWGTVEMVERNKKNALLQNDDYDTKIKEYKRLLAAALYLIALFGSFLLLKKTIDANVSPLLSNTGWVTKPFIGIIICVGILLAIRFLRLLLPLISHLGKNTANAGALMKNRSKKVAVGTTSIFCSACGESNPADVAFCSECGEKIS